MTDNFGDLSLAKFLHINICDLSQQDDEIINLRTWLENSTYDEYRANYPKIMTAFDDKNIKRNPDLIEQLNQVSNIFEVLKASDDPNASGNQPLIDVDLAALAINKAGLN